MRARAAFISSLGTTGILVAAALLMLGLVSALVAFRGWPGGVTDSVASVPVARAADTPVALTQVRRVAPPRAVLRVARVTRAGAPRPVTTTGLVKETSVGSAPADIVKVPPGVHMTLPSPHTPTAAPAPAAATPIDQPAVPVTPEDPPPSLLPNVPPPPGSGPQDVGETLDDVVGPLPDADSPGYGPPVAIEGDQGATTIGITIGDTSLSVSFGPRG